MGTRILALFCALTAGVLVFLIIRASLEKSVLEIFRLMWAEKWGVVTLIDLYAGFVITGALIAVVERRPLRVIPWLVGMFFLGNLATLIWVLYRARRAPDLRSLFTPAPDPTGSSSER